MCEGETIIVMLPAEVASALVDEGRALPVPTARIDLPATDILVTGLTVLTTPITLAQAPAAIEDLVRRLIAWRRRSVLVRDPVVSVEARGPGGRASIQLTAMATEEELAQVLSLVLPRGNAAEPAGEAPPPATPQ